MTEEAANQTKLQFSGNTNGPAMHSNVAQHPVGHSFQDQTMMRSDNKEIIYDASMFVINRDSSVSYSRSHSDGGQEIYNSLKDNHDVIGSQELISSPPPDIHNDFNSPYSKNDPSVNANGSFSNESNRENDQIRPLQIEEGNSMNPNEKVLSPTEQALAELVEEALRQLKTFLIIIYGCCVRFYSTVVDWEYIQRMSEDLIERMTSKLFEDAEFSTMVVQLCGELTRE